MTATLTKPTRRADRIQIHEPHERADAAPDVPGEHWSLHELGARAMVEYGRIDHADKLVTPAYWYLGRALNAARKHFKRGTWQRWLAEHKIGDDCALRARLIGKAFGDPSDVAGLSLRKAVAMAKGRQPKPSAARLLRNLESRLQGAVKAASALAKQTETRHHRATLVAVIEQALDALGGVRRRCQSQAEPSSGKEIA